MPPRRIYTEEDRASAYVVWAANAGNVKRTTRDTGISGSTLRDWIREWESGSIPDINLVEVIAGDFVDNATRVRDKALLELERKIPDATPSALVAAVGALTDKINLTKGLATSRTETVHALPAPEEIAAALTAAFKGALQAAEQRDLEIIDAQVVEVRELPASP